MKRQKQVEKSSIPHEEPKSVGVHDGCGAKKKSGGVCIQPKGWGTSHPGRGRCKLHGGSSPIKTGQYSGIKRESLEQAIEKYKTDPALLDLRREVAVLRALVEDKIDTMDEANPDHNAVAQLIDKVGAMVDRIQRHKANKSMSLAALNRFVEQLGVEVAMAALEAIPDLVVRDKLLLAIERRWGALKLDAYSTGNSRAVSLEEEV